MNENEQLRAEITSWRTLCNLLRDELRKVRTDLIMAKNELSCISALAKEAGDRRPTQHPEHLPPEAMRFVETLFMSPSVAEQDRAEHGEGKP